MASVKIPLLSSTLLRNASRIFIGVGDILTHLFPNMKNIVEQSGVKESYGINHREYLAFCAFTSLLIFIGLGGLITGLLLLKPGSSPSIGLIIGGALGCTFFMYLIVYPQSIVNKRVKNLERNLLFALRTLLIQIRSGVPIFNAMASVAIGNYGQIADEFKLVVEKVSAGRDVKDVLEEMAVRNPSIYFRRALWQMVNSLKSGSDVGKNLEDVIKSLSKEQLVEINRYKSILNPLSMMYMMVAVIAPSLGITMLIILSFFPNMDKLANENIFWGLMICIIFLQFIFLGLIKSKRPNLLGS
ncbi:MAG: type II secretion system F family protein [Candidatus Altiarchaeota archaeon]